MSVSRLDNVKAGDYVFFVRYDQHDWRLVHADSVDEAARKYADSFMPNAEGYPLQIFRAADVEPAHRTVTVETEVVKHVEVRP